MYISKYKIVINSGIWLNISLQKKS